MAIIRFLQRLWRAVRAPLVFLSPLRFVVIPLALLFWTLIFADEGQDAIRAVVEFTPCCPRWGGVLWFLTWVVLLALQAWYWSRQLLRIDFSRSTEGEEGEGRLRTEKLAHDYSRTHEWTPRILGLSAFVIAIAALARTATLDYTGQWDYTLGVIVRTIVLLVTAMVLFILFVVWRRKRIGRSPRVASQKELAPITRIILWSTGTVAVLFVVWTAVSPLTAGVAFPAPTLLMLSAALWIAIGSTIVYLSDRYHVPLITTLVVLAVLFSLVNDNHAVRKLASADGGGDVTRRRDLTTTFDDWRAALQQKYPQEATHPVYIVATEGGGIRAAYWTAAVLSAIQDQAPSFADHLFAISSVSGGSLGGTLFTALTGDRDRGATIPDCQCASSGAIPAPRNYRFAAQQILSYDFLAPTLASMLHADLVQRFLPVGFLPDRARALETSWERGWRTHVRSTQGARDDFFGSGFAKMYADPRNALLPSLFLNGTVVEEGNRTIASNCVIGPEIPDGADILNTLRSDMRLSTAAHNSARFTYVSPAGSIVGTTLVGHVVDGGYFENSGAQTAGDVLRYLQTLNRPGLSFNLILIRFQEVSANGEPVPPPGPTRFMNEALSPLRALLDTRGARGTLAYAEAQRLVPAQNQFEFLLTQEDGGVVLPLGWLLAPRTRNAIDLQIGTEVRQDLSPAIKRYVERNVGFLKTITAQLALPGVESAPKSDPVQHKAIEEERQVKQ